MNTRCWILCLACLGIVRPAGAAAPRLLVVISVDQMRAEYLDRWAHEYTGGFKTLREEGARVHKEILKEAPR